MHTNCPECNLIFTPEQHEQELESLRQKLAVAEEALGFYASIGIWGNGCAAIDPCDTYFCDKNVLRGGIKAREALAKIRGEV